MTNFAISLRRPASPLLFAGCGFFVFAVVTFINAGGSTLRWCIATLLTALGATLLALGWPRAARVSVTKSTGPDGRPRATIDGRVPFEAELLELVALEDDDCAYLRSFGAALVARNGERRVLFVSDDPARVVAWAREKFPEFVPNFTWGTGDLLRRRDGEVRVPRDEAFRGASWSESARVTRLMSLILVAIAGAWITFLAEAPSAVDAVTVALGASVWLIVATVTIMGASDRVELEWGESLVVRRRRLGVTLLERSLPFASLQRLECLEHARGAGFLLIQADEAFAVPLDPATRRALARALEQRG